MTLRDDVVGTLWPDPASEHGRLPQLLLMLTVVTGLVDAVSYLKLGHVFVANMTGNVVFLGFGIAGAKGLSAGASLAAIGSFLLGSLTAGRFGARFNGNRERLLRTAVAVKLVLVGAATIVAVLGGHHLGAGSRYALIVLLAVAMGIQNSTARRLAVPDLTTTVLTLTLTGIASDSRIAGGSDSRIGRRLLSVLAMLLGALVGALLVLKVANWVPLAIAAALLALVGLVRARTER